MFSTSVCSSYWTRNRSVQAMLYFTISSPYISLYTATRTRIAAFDSPHTLSVCIAHTRSPRRCQKGALLREKRVNGIETDGSSMSGSSK